MLNYWLVSLVWKATVTVATPHLLRKAFHLSFMYTRKLKTSLETPFLNIELQAWYEEVSFRKLKKNLFVEPLELHQLGVVKADLFSLCMCFLV